MREKVRGFVYGVKPKNLSIIEFVIVIASGIVAFIGIIYGTWVISG